MHSGMHFYSFFGLLAICLMLVVNFCWGHDFVTIELLDSTRVTFLLNVIFIYLCYIFWCCSPLDVLLGRDRYLLLYVYTVKLCCI